MKGKIKLDASLVGTIILIVIGYVFIHDLLGGTLFDHNHWDSYTLQAMAWLDGKVGLGQNYSWLELAIYDNDWFVSFPPFPSVLMLPWAFIAKTFGGIVHNNILMIVYTIITIILVNKCLKFFKYSEEQSAFWSVVVVLGSNMMWMSTMGGVWFQAQLLNMLFCVIAVLCAFYDKRIPAFICLACAFGCRPFSLFYYAVLFVWFYKKDVEKNQINGKKNGNQDKVISGFDKLKNILVIVFKGQWRACIVPACMAVGYMIYNYVRFDSPFEFGHNYLPEFTESENGQFNMVYLLENLSNLFIRGFKFKENLRLEIPIFNGFWFYIANPFFLIMFACIIKNLKNKDFDIVRIVLLVCMFANIIALCIHKTLGGWQFGARYTVDLIPFALMYVLLSKKEAKFEKWETYVGIFAIMFNLYGVMYIYLGMG